MMTVPLMAETEPVIGWDITVGGGDDRMVVMIRMIKL